MVKKVKKFNYQKDLKKAWKKKKETKNPKVDSDALKNFWDENKSMEANYRELGLSMDPNKTFEIPKAKSILRKLEFMDLDEAKAQAEQAKSSIQQQQGKQQTTKATKAVKHLEELASKVTEKVYNLNEDDILYCIYMMEKYGEDYVKMAKDYQNYYQDTPAQIKKKINLFKQMKYRYKQYLDEKKAGVDFLAKLDYEASL